MSKKRIKLKIADEPISQRDVLLIALIGMLVGGTVFWFFAAAFWGFKVFESAGSGADLLAAAGTWIIGLAAVGFTRDERRHNRREQRFAADKRQREVKGRIRLMSAKTRLLHKPYEKMARFYTKPPSQRRVVGLMANLHAGEQAVRIVEWSEDERFLLSEEGIVALTEVELRVQRYYFILQMFHDLKLDWSLRVETRKMEFLFSVLSDIRALKRASEVLQQHIDAIDIEHHVCGRP